MNIKLKIMGTLIGLAIAPSAFAFSVVSYHSDPTGADYNLTADGGFIYRSAYNSSTIEKYDTSGNFVSSFTAVGARGIGAEGGVLATANVSSNTISLWDLSTNTLIGTSGALTGTRHGVAYNATLNTAYYQNYFSENIYAYDFNTNTETYLGNFATVAMAGGASLNYIEDLEYAGGFLWAIDGTDSDIHKFNLDGSYVGTETTDAGLHIEGFGYDETTASFWAHSYYTPTFGAQIGVAGRYVQELSGFTTIKPPTTVPVPATLALMGLGLLGFGFRRRQ